MHVVFVLCAHEPRLRVVSNFDDRQMNRQSARAYAFPRVACRLSLARERPFAHSSVSYSKSNMNAPPAALCLTMLWVLLVNLTA